MTTTTRSSTTRNASLLSLRNVVLADAGVSGINGLAYLAGAMVLDSILGPSAAFLAIIGAVLLGWSAALGWVGTRSPIVAGQVREVGIGNLVWVAGSVVVLALMDLTVIGAVWCVLQAIVVAGFAVLQLRGIRGVR